MKLILKRFSAAFAALAVMAAAVVFDLSAKTASAASCNGNHLSATALTADTETPIGDGSYFLDAPVTLSKELVVEGDVTLCLNGQTITAASNSRVFKIINGGSLTICDCGSTGKIIGGDVSGGVDGGSDSYGGAIFVDKNCALTLESGTISGCSAQRGGGVCVSGGTFTMNGGTISTNIAAHQGGGVYVTERGTFTMNGGAISGNTVVGDGGTDGGGGVYTSETFIMNGSGIISGNKADKSYGGGVLVSGSRAQFTLQSGTISGNNANYGGGVHISSSGKFEMSGGNIGSGNTASGGAGVCLGTGNGSFTMTSGTITGNTSDYGGGIQMNGGTMTFDGAVTIKDNLRKDGKDSNVYLRETSQGAPACFKITIGASFNPTTVIGVHVQPTLKCQDEIETTQFAANAPAKNISSHFKADDKAQVIKDNEDDNIIRLFVEHDWGEWTITKAPTMDAEGSAKRVCKKNSSHVETLVLPPLSDTTAWTKDPDKDEYTHETVGPFSPSTYVPPTPPVNNNSNNNNNNNYDYDDDDDDDYYTPNPEPASSNSEAFIYKDPPTGISLSLAPSVMAIVAITALLIRRKK